MKQIFIPGYIIQLKNVCQELRSEGFADGDLVDAQREFIDGSAKASLWFRSKTTGNNCVAYLNDTCNIVSEPALNPSFV